MPARDEWFERRTFHAHDWTLDALRTAKGRSSVAVVLPALDEEATVGAIVTSIRAHLLGDLVDDLVVLDSGSSDRTAEVAVSAGARVVRRDDVLPRIPTVPGKGEAMWRAVAATDADIVVFVDADLQSFTPAYVTGLLGPLLTRPSVSLVKAAYERPLVEGARTVPAGGGRVTELVARPLLNLHWPSLAGVVQPLSGEYAARRDLLERLSFPCGYGVEFAILVDTVELLGIDAVAQVDLGVRVHRHHDDRRLGRMAAEIWQVALDRLDPDGRIRRARPLGTTLAQFDRDAGGFVVTDHDIPALERPPLVSVPDYALA